MKIVILSRNPRLYSTRRLVESAEARKHQVLVLDPLKCFMDITSRKPKVHYKELVLEDVDAVIPRIGASITFYGTAVLRQFEMMGSASLNTALAITRSRDKLRSMQILARKGIGMPITGFAHSTKMTDPLIHLVRGAPLIIKLLEGTQGTGVVLAETHKAAQSVIDAFRNLDAYFLVQEFIKESSGTDMRAFVVGNHVVAAMRRTGKEGEFRSNLHRGGVAEIIELTEEETSIAVRTSKAMGLHVAGVDMVRSHRGPLVLEVNSSPGLQGIEKATQEDVAGMIIQFIEKTLKRRK